MESIYCIFSLNLKLFPILISYLLHQNHTSSFLKYLRDSLWNKRKLKVIGTFQMLSIYFSFKLLVICTLNLFMFHSMHGIYSFKNHYELKISFLNSEDRHWKQSPIGTDNEIFSSLPCQRPELRQASLQRKEQLLSPVGHGLFLWNCSQGLIQVRVQS